MYVFSEKGNCLKKAMLFVAPLALLSFSLFSQKCYPFNPDFNKPSVIPGIKLVSNDEFTYTGKPDPSFRICEKGFCRNREL